MHMHVHAYLLKLAWWRFKMVENKASKIKPSISRNAALVTWSPGPVWQTLRYPLKFQGLEVRVWFQKASGKALAKRLGLAKRSFPKARFSSEPGPGRQGKKPLSTPCHKEGIQRIKPCCAFFMVGSESHVECLDLTVRCCSAFLMGGSGSPAGCLDLIVRCCSAFFMVGSESQVDHS